MIYYTGTNILEKIYTFPNWTFENDKFNTLKQAKSHYGFVFKVNYSKKLKKITKFELIK